MLALRGGRPPGSLRHVPLCEAAQNRVRPPVFDRQAAVETLSLEETADAFVDYCLSPERAPPPSGRSIRPRSTAR